MQAHQFMPTPATDAYRSTPQHREAQRLEEHILGFSGLRVHQDLHVYDVPVLGSEWLHTVCCGQEHDDANNKGAAHQTPPIVLLHGYGNTLTTLFRMLRPLSAHSKVYAVDMPGMGLSSRPDFTKVGAAASAEYLVAWLESWRETLGLEKVVLAGHSFGGYVAALYAAAHPQRVAKLHLISPIGVTRYTEDELQRQAAEAEANIKWYWRPMFNYARNGWYAGECVTTIFQKWWMPTSFFLNRFIARRLGLQGAQADAFKEFYAQVLRMRASCEKAFNQLFRFPRMRAHIALQEELPNKVVAANPACRVHFYYGDNDWMECSGAKALAQNGAGQYTFDLITKSGHNINLNNPDELCALIIKYNQELFEKK